MRSDRWLGPLLSLLSLGWLVLAYLYIPASNVPGEPGPRAFPNVLGYALLMLGLVMTVSGFSRRREAAPAKANAGDDAPAAPLKHELRIVLGTFGLLLLYAFLMEKTGFLVSTPIVLVLGMAGILRMRNWRFIALMNIGTTLVCWIVFSLLLRVPLPRGSWWWLL
ncbi:MAG: tripartite tricarboxylate transporter TctB family protein [Rubrivivax sp.]|nr:tripartite tricarboxylate transporter TctB family protein [Rubrivivax sp.]